FAQRPPVAGAQPGPTRSGQASEPAQRYSYSFLAILLFKFFSVCSRRSIVFNRSVAQQTSDIHFVPRTVRVDFTDLTAISIDLIFGGHSTYCRTECALDQK